MIKGHCSYCGSEPRNVAKAFNGDFGYNGLDRIDNTKGYEPGNVVTCCFICNNAKRTLSVAEFMGWAKALYEHSILKGAGGVG
jgi:hypothetical protein